MSSGSELRDAVQRIEELTGERNVLKAMHDRLALDWEKIEGQLDQLAAKWNAQYHTCTHAEQAAECAAELRTMFGLQKRGSQVHCYPHKTSWLQGAAEGCPACKLELQLRELREAVRVQADRYARMAAVDGSVTAKTLGACADDLRAMLKDK